MKGGQGAVRCLGLVEEEEEVVEAVGGLKEKVVEWLEVAGWEGIFCWDRQGETVVSVCRLGDWLCCCVHLVIALNEERRK